MKGEDIVNALLKFPAVLFIETNTVATLTRDPGSDQVVFIEGGGESPHSAIAAVASFKERQLGVDMLGVECTLEVGGCGCAEVVVIQPLEYASLWKNLGKVS